MENPETVGGVQKIITFSRDPRELWFTGLLPPHHALQNTTAQLAALPEFARLRKVSAVHPPLFGEGVVNTFAVKTPECKILAKILEKTHNKRLMLELEFETLPALKLEFPTSLKRIEGECVATKNHDSIRRILEPETFSIGARLVMRLRFYSKDGTESISGVSVRVISYNKKTRTPTWTVAIPSEHNEFRMTLHHAASAFDNGVGGPVSTIDDDGEWPPNSAETIAKLSKHILTRRINVVVHQENKLVVNLETITKPPNAKLFKEFKIWSGNFNATHAVLGADVGGADADCLLNPHLPENSKSHYKV